MAVINESPLCGFGLYSIFWTKKAFKDHSCKISLDQHTWFNQDL